MMEHMLSYEHVSLSQTVVWHFSIQHLLTRFSASYNIYTQLKKKKCFIAQAAVPQGLGANCVQPQ